MATGSDSSLFWEEIHRAEKKPLNYTGLQEKLDNCKLLKEIVDCYLMKWLAT